MLNQGDAGKYSMQTKIIKVVKKKIKKKQTRYLRAYCTDNIG